MERAAGIGYRAAGPPDGPAVLLVHGFPESSYMWRAVVGALAEAGWRAIAPDLPGFGDTPPDPPGTWERQVEALERFRTALGIRRTALVVHDWGGLIGLRWACDHPDAVTALVISSTGFFPDGRWHGLAEGLRTEGQGEQLVANLDRGGFGALLRQTCPTMSDAALDEYWKALAEEPGRRNALELYRSGDFEKLRPYQGRLAGLGVPAFVLWGEQDAFAPVAGAHRLHSELPGSELVVLEGTGHFVVEDAPERYAAEVVRFLRERRVGR